MFGSEVLEVGIGMALLFLFMALISTALREMVEGIFKTRAKDLERGIKEMLADGRGTEFVQEFYDHPVIASLYKDEFKSRSRALPSYIPSKSFSLAILDIVSKAAKAGPLTTESLRDELGSLASPNPVQKVVLAALKTSEGDFDKLRTTVETWYDGTMDRVSGWYKRRTARFLFLWGLAGAVVMNVDALTVAMHLMQDGKLRNAAVAEAESLSKGQQGGAASTGAQNNPAPAPAASPAPAGANRAPQAPATPQAGGGGSNAGSDGVPSQLANMSLDQLRSEFATIRYPVGWIYVDDQGRPVQGKSKDLYTTVKDLPTDLWEKRLVPEPQACRLPGPGQKAGGCSYGMTTGAWLVTLVGWFVTALAIMLGAPFWFDVLNKFMVIRSTVKPREKSQEEASEDRQPPAPAARIEIAQVPGSAG